MKIIEHGKYYEKNSIITCGMCNCKFEISETDKEIEEIPIHIQDLTYSFKTGTFVKCPECKTKIQIIEISKFQN